MPSQLLPGDQANPYAAPNSRIDDLEVRISSERASRGTRLGAAMLDGLVVFVPIMVIAALGGFFGRTGGTAWRNALPFMMIGFGLVAGAWAIANLVLVFRYQQTIGKRFLKIKVARSDGSPCNPWRIILLRGFVMGLLNNIPFVGPLLGLVDPLLIFREDQRCLHDHIADTIVVRA